MTCCSFRESEFFSQDPHRADHHLQIQCFWFLLLAFLDTVVVWIRLAPIGSYIWIHGHQEWHYLRGIRNGGLTRVGGTFRKELSPCGWPLRFQKVQSKHRVFLFLLPTYQDVEPPGPSPAPCLSAFCQAHSHDDSGVDLWNYKLVPIK